MNRDDVLGLEFEWIAMARHGVFSYDYGVSYGPYQLVARPVRAIVISALPAHIQQIIRHVSFEQICFATTPTITPEQLTEC